MENIKNHLFNLVRITVFTAIVGLSVSMAQGVFKPKLLTPIMLPQVVDLLSFITTQMLMLTLQVGLFADGQMIILIHKMM